MNDPALFARANRISRIDTRNIAKEFSDEISRMSGHCLEIGSGPGDISVDIILPSLDPRAKLFCADISEKMLEYAEAKYKDQRRVSFIELNIETTDLPKDLIGQFDHAISFYCFHWCQDLPQVIENIFKLLRPGGTVLLSFMTQVAIFDTYKVLAAMPRYQPYMKNVDFHIPPIHLEKQPQEIFEALVKTVGFEIHHSSLRKINYTAETVQEMKELLLSVNPFIDRIPVDLKDNFMKDLLSDFVRRSVISNTSVNNENEFSVTFRYTTSVAYLKKPKTI